MGSMPETETLMKIYVNNESELVQNPIFVGAFFSKLWIVIVSMLVVSV